MAQPIKRGDNDGLVSERARLRMVELLRAQGVRSPAVLRAMSTVPRHIFVEHGLASRAYEDVALPIGHGQTISQPWVVARMTEAVLEGLPAHGTGDAAPKVLEVGTGSGYQAAILAALGLQVFTVERIGELLRTARKRFRTLDLHVRSKHDDGRAGWPELAPYDAIVVTAAAPALVDALSMQLAPGGTLVAPVGGAQGQSLLRLRRTADGRLEQSDLGPVVFVPLLSGLVDR